MRKTIFWGILANVCATYAFAEETVRTAQGIDKALLGQILFFDKMISHQGSQNCASCHNQNNGFIDDRETSAQKMVSQGDDPTKFGRRNAQTMSYARFSPDFHFDEQTQEYIGGQFWDGRAKNLAEQAGQPPLDPNEMGMPSKLAVAERLVSLPLYQKYFTQFYGIKVWETPETVYAAMQDLLATFQKEKSMLAPFDAKYDQYLAGKAQLTALEEQGRALFFDKNKTNCTACHQLHTTENKTETFTNYHYYNIGTPSNQKLIAHNKLAADYVDLGLFENPAVNGDEKQKGKFKTPTLRNIAITMPYMHNGVFSKLNTVLQFLDSYNNPERKINPETGLPWDKAEYAPTVAHEKLKAKPLTDDDLKALEAFLNTLTDARFVPKEK